MSRSLMRVTTAWTQVARTASMSGRPLRRSMTLVGRAENAGRDPPPDPAASGRPIGPRCREGARETAAACVINSASAWVWEPCLTRSTNWPNSAAAAVDSGSSAALTDWKSSPIVLGLSPSARMCSGHWAVCQRSRPRESTSAISQPALANKRVNVASSPTSVDSLGCTSCSSVFPATHPDASWLSPRRAAVWRSRAAVWRAGVTGGVRHRGCAEMLRTGAASV